MRVPTVVSNDNDNHHNNNNRTVILLILLTTRLVSSPLQQIVHRARAIQLIGAARIRASKRAGSNSLRTPSVWGLGVWYITVCYIVQYITVQHSKLQCMILIIVQPDCQTWRELGSSIISESPRGSQISYQRISLRTNPRISPRTNPGISPRINRSFQK